MASLLIDHLNHEIDGLKVLVIPFDRVFPVELDLKFIVVDLLSFEFGFNH